MKPAFEFPSETARREGSGNDTKLTNDEIYPTISRLDISLTPRSFHAYLRDTRVENIDADIGAFQSEAKILQDSTQALLKEDREWKRGMQMTVSGTNALMGMMLSLGVLPDGISRKDLQGETPIKKEIFPLLDRDYQVRVDIETQNLVVRKCQLEMLQASKAHKSPAAAASGLVDTIDAGTTKLLTIIQSAVAEKEALRLKLDAVQQERGRVEAELMAYPNPFHEPDIDHATVSRKFHKAFDDLKAGKALPRPSVEDSTELLKGMAMQTTDEMTGKVAWGTDTDGRPIGQIAEEERKTFGEILEEVGEAKKEFEEQKGEGKEGERGPK